MTSPQNSPDSAASVRAQPLLPFAENELLAVRIRPAEFARIVGVSRESVSRWIKEQKVSLGADGRLNPTKAFRELLRTSDPGRIRTRLVARALADLQDTRELAARAADLAQQVAALNARISDLEVAADAEHATMEHWLDEFGRRVAEIGPDVRAALDAEAWRAHIAEIMRGVLDQNAFEEVDVGMQDLATAIELEALGEVLDPAPLPPVKGGG